MTGSPQVTARHLHQLFDEGTVASLSDADLVARFADRRDPEAFAALVARHGPMVLAVCRGISGPLGGDDAFQATFLVLLDRIGTFPVGDSLGGWLRRVAGRVARHARVAEARRHRREAAAATRDRTPPDRAAERAETAALIRQEVDRLPERLRVPVVLCELQGLTRDEAAKLLGCPPGTVAGRLARARSRLRDRLERRGVAPAVALTSATLTPWRTTLAAATRAATALATAAPATRAAVTLARAAPAARASVAVPSKVALALALVPCLALGLVAARPATITPPTSLPTAPLPPTSVAATPPALAGDPDDPTLAGHFAGRVIGPDGGPVAGARVYLVPWQPTADGPGPVRARTDAAGRFAFDAPDLTFLAPDGLPARRPGLLMAAADGLAPDGTKTSGHLRANETDLWPQTRAADPTRKGDEIVLRLATDDVSIRGRLLDAQGRPLAGARVRLDALNVAINRDLDAYLEQARRGEFRPPVERSFNRPRLLPGVDRAATADGDGRFVLRGLGRDRLADLAVNAPGMDETYLGVMTRDAPDFVLGPNPEGGEDRKVRGADFTVRLPTRPTVALAGVVRDRDTQRPIPGMTIAVGGYYPELPPRGPSAVTDAEGRFTLDGIAADLVKSPPPPAQGHQPPPLSIFAVAPADLPSLTANMSVGSGPPVASPPSAALLLPYAMGSVVADRPMGLVIECARGIPFRLRVVDDAGATVDGTVEYYPLSPNPHYHRLLPPAPSRAFPNNIAHNVAVRRGPGLYEGYAIPGPGAVLVSAADPSGYRPAQVDPKAFFAPGRNNWTDQERITTYGDAARLSTASGSSVRQSDHEAIVLIDPPAGSGPLELTARLVRDRPIMVTLVDAKRQPVVGAKSPELGMLPLRVGTFPLRRLSLGAAGRITFVHESRKLVGFLMPRLDAEEPIKVLMKPWAALSGRLLDEQGKPIVSGPGAMFERPTIGMTTPFELDRLGDPGFGKLPYIRVDNEGRFRAERLVPGQRHSAEVYRGFGMDAGPAFEDVVLGPGEVRDLGDIVTRKPVDVRGR